MAYQISGNTVIDDSRNITGPTITASNLFNIPSGNTASRPTSTTGSIYFNTQTNEFEMYNGSSWIRVSTIAA
jgi:hypothetical protein